MALLVHQSKLDGFSVLGFLGAIAKKYILLEFAHGLEIISFSAQGLYNSSSVNRIHRYINSYFVEFGIKMGSIVPTNSNGSL